MLVRELLVLLLVIQKKILTSY